MPRIIHLMSGLPGSGKTYYLKHHITEELNPNAIILHRDDIRAELRAKLNSNKYYSCDAATEYDYWIKACCDTIISHPKANDFYFDQTTISPNAFLKFYRTLHDELLKHNCSIYDFVFIIELIQTPLEVCIANNEKRSGHDKIPVSAIKRMAKSFKNGLPLLNLKYLPPNVTIRKVDILNA